MSATWTRWRPAARRARARAALAATTALALLVAPIVGAAPAVAAPTGTLSNVAITVTDDGTASVGGIDPATDNGVVATNNPVTMRWEIEATDLVDGVFSQTLPAGWSWVASSLGRLTSTSTLYQSSYVISPDGLTLTATISVPGSSLVTISGLQAVPAPTVASGSGHTPTVTATDGGTTQTATGTALTVASTPQAELGMYYASRSGATHDFGSGDEAAVRVAALLLYRAQATLVGQRLPLEVELPQRLTLAYTGPQPDAVTLCDDDTSGSLTLVSAADGTIVVDLLTQPTTALAAPRVCFWYRTADLPVGATDAETLTVSLVEPGLTTTDGTAVVRSGTDSTSTSVYVDSPDVPVVPPRPATASTNLARWSWSSNPAGPVLPAYSTRAWTTGLPNAVDSGGTILTQSLYTPAYDYAAGTSVGTEDLVGYQFWDPATATIVDDESAVAVSRSTTALDPSTYRLEFTSTRSTTDPATANTWYPTIAEAGGPTAVSGVRVVYTAGLWADGQASGTTSQLVLGVPTVARADGVVTSMSVTHVWTTADADPLLRYTTVGIQPFSMNANLSSSDAQIVSGGPVTFSVSVGAGHSTTRPPTAPDFEGVVTLTVTMPPQVISVDTSAATAAGWTLVSETPADVGADGLPGTSDDGAGIVLVLSRDAVVTVAAAADLPAFSLPTVTTLRAPANETMTATLSARYDVTSPVPTAMAASASRAVSVLQAQGLVMEGSTSTPHLAATDRTAVWSTRWSNYNNTVIEGTSYVMDVLPYVGDGRGTTGEGRVTLAGAELRGEALTTGVIEVTTAAPGTIGTAPGSGVTWTELTEDTDLSAVTAVRVRLSSIAVGAVSGLDLTTTVSGHDLGDVFVNSASSYSEATTLVMSSPDVAVEVVGSTVAGRVLTDPDRDGLATSDGEPAAGVTVRLVDTGSDVVLTAVTGADGSYSFTGVGSGTYRVEVVQSTLSGSSVTPTVDPDDVLDGMTEVTVGLQDEVTGLDFAFAVRNPALTVSTAGEAPSGSLAAGDVVTFVSTVTNSGDAPLSGLVVQDDLAAGRATGTWTWPGAAGALAAGESATYTVRYTLDQTDVDAGSVSTTVRATASDDVGTEVTGTATAQVTVPAGAALTVTGAGTPPAAVAADGTVRWTVTIENTGAATVTGIDLTDTLAGMSGWTI
ncbi:MAG TPA: SdrD B-like domain-containing protein, partial [Cellulomonas sp.]